MAKKARIKLPAADMPVPQSRDEAAGALNRIGEIGRELARRQADMNDSIGRIKEACEQAAEPLRVEGERLTIGLKTWCDANRTALTNDNRVKEADLGTGLVRWRRRPPKVTLRDVEGVLARLRLLGLDRFIRVKAEVNKEAMQDEPEVARQVDGVTIGSEGEEFIVVPFEAELKGAAA